jgi:hypothetical protein
VKPTKKSSYYHRKVKTTKHTGKTILADTRPASVRYRKQLRVGLPADEDLPLAPQSSHAVDVGTQTIAR